MMPQALKDAILTEYGQDALAAVVIETWLCGNLPLGWGIVATDGDSASGTYRLRIAVDPRFAIWTGGEWQTPRWFEPKGQLWARRVLGDFGS